jgi:hypothetical protein
VADDVTDGVAESAQAEGLADDEGVYRDREDPGLICVTAPACRRLVDHHFGELPPTHSKTFLIH